MTELEASPSDLTDESGPSPKTVEVRFLLRRVDYEVIAELARRAETDVADFCADVVAMRAVEHREEECCPKCSSSLDPYDGGVSWTRRRPLRRKALASGPEASTN